MRNLKFYLWCRFYSNPFCLWVIALWSDNCFKLVFIHLVQETYVVIFLVFKRILLVSLLLKFFKFSNFTRDSIQWTYNFAIKTHLMHDCTEIKLFFLAKIFLFFIKITQSLLCKLQGFSKLLIHPLTNPNLKVSKINFN